MASSWELKADSRQGPQFTSVKDLKPLTQALEKELRLRDMGNANTVSTSPASPPTTLTHTLASCLSNIQSKSSSRYSTPRSVGDEGRRVDSYFGLVSPAHSSDSSKSCGAVGLYSFKDADSTPITSGHSFAVATHNAAGDESKNYYRCIGNAHQAPGGEAASRSACKASGSGGAKASPAYPPPTSALRGRSSSVGSTTGKVTKRRSRASKKPPTKIVEAGAADFRAMVQQLTGGYVPPSINASSLTEKDKMGMEPRPPVDAFVVRPQPSRANAMGSESLPDNVTTDAGAPSIMPSVGCSSPVSPAQGANFSYRESNSTSCTSGLDYLMGCSSQPFVSGLEPRATEGLGESSMCNTSFPSVCASELMALFESHKPHSSSAFPATSFLEMPSLWERNSRSDNISRENSSFSGESMLSSSDRVSTSSMGENLVPRHLTAEMRGSLDLDEDLECTAMTQSMVDSWISSDYASCKHPFANHQV